MQKAKAIYRAGEIVSATECDYNSAKILGLICPFCLEPVFLCEGSTRVTSKGKVFVVDKYFAHYQSSPKNWDCEQRAKTKAGREFLEKQKLASKGQRLELFNNYFWAMVRDSAGYPKAPEPLVRQYLNSTDLVSLVKKTQEFWIDNLEGTYKLLEAFLNQSLEELAASNELLVSQIRKDPKDGLARAILRTRKQVVDKRLHRAIAYEACDFLATPKSGYAMKKMVATAIWMDLRIKPVKTVSDLRGLASDMFAALLLMLATTDWIGQVQVKEECTTNITATKSPSTLLI